MTTGSNSTTTVAEDQVKDLTVPKPSAAYLLKPQPDRPIVVFSDFDGTIFMQDTGHVLFDNYGCGPERREYLDSNIGKTLTFRDASNEMWGSLNVSLPKALDTLKSHLVMDKDFMQFFDYTQQHNIPFTVISAGLKPLLRGALDQFLGKERSAKVNIISNDGKIEGDKWQAIWRHDSELGHDKAKSVAEFRESVNDVQPLLVFIGDGVSDLPAARHADVLFARKGLLLENYCIEHQIPYIPYDSFADIQKDLELLVAGNKYHDLHGALFKNIAPSVPQTPKGPIPSYFPDTTAGPAASTLVTAGSGKIRPTNLRTVSNLSTGER